MLVTQRQQQISLFQNWTVYCCQSQNRDFHLNQIGIKLGYVRPGNNQLSPKTRAAILQHIIYKIGWELPQEPLSWLIFGKDAIAKWSQIDKQHYPHFQLIIAVKLGDECLLLSCHHQPLPGAPEIPENLDFSWQPFWDNVEMFWGDYPQKTSNDLELDWVCYPDEQSFSTGQVMSKTELTKSLEDAREAIALAGYDPNQFCCRLQTR